MLTPRSVFRYYEVDGVPSSGKHEPKKSEIIQLLEQMQGSASAPAVVRQTRADLESVTPVSETYGGMVLDDPNPANNGYYSRSGGVWVFGRGFPDTFGLLVSVGGTANAITASVPAGVDPAQVLCVLLTDPPGTNTSSAVTLTISGETLPVKAASGANLAIGDIIDGVGTLFFRAGSEWRQLFSSATGATFDHQGEYNDPTTYTKGQVVTGSDGNWYQLKVDSAAGDDPVGSVTGNWLKILNGAAIADRSIEEQKLTFPLSAKIGALFDTVADLLADISLTYSNVAPGDVVTAQDFRYEVAASGATDAHETTAGGVKLYEAGPTFTTRGRLARADLSFKQVYLAEGARSGWFEQVLISSLSARDQGRVTYDETNGQGVFVISSIDSSYVWRRSEYLSLGYVLAEWWGAEHYVFGGPQDSTVAFEAASAFVGVGGKWRWTGLHRITGQVLCRAQQSVGSFGQTKDVDHLICLDPTAFTGVNTATVQNLTSAVYADVADGVSAFFALGPVEFHDFTMYGGGYTLAASDGSKAIRYPSGTITDWRDQRGIKYSKHITTCNVTLAMFRYPLLSEDGPAGGQGNYYSKHINTDVVQCYAGFRVRSVDSYNTECHSCRMTVAVFGSFDVGVRNFKFFGGSVEHFSQPTIIRNGPSDLTFYGTYFETLVGNSPLSTHWLFECTGASLPQIGFEHCLVYLNHFRGLFFAQGTNPAGPHIMKSFGNRFVLSSDDNDTADSHIIWHPGTSVARAGVFMADSLVKNSANTKTVTYVTGVTSSYAVMGSLTTSAST